MLWLFYREYDLFASVLLALYSSVFVLLSLFILYFSRYWGKLGSSNVSLGEVAVLDMLVLLAALFSSFGLFYCDGSLLINSGFTYSSYSWLFSLVAYDYYDFGDKNTQTVVLMHSVMYRLFAVEIFFFNLYLFFGLVFSVGLLYIFKLWLNPAVIGHIFSLMRFTFFFSFPANYRVRVMNKFKRQTRRKNSSHVKYR